MDEITLRIDNPLRQTANHVGEHEWCTGTTVVEMDSQSNGGGVHIYIQKKGFGSSSSKSVRTTISNEHAQEIADFLLRHIALSRKVEAMQKAAEI